MLLTSFMIPDVCGLNTNNPLLSIWLSRKRESLYLEHNNLMGTYEERTLKNPVILYLGHIIPYIFKQDILNPTLS